MGMRASIVYITKQGTAKQTLLHWSTMLDLSLAEELTGIKPEERVKHLAKIFRTITKHRLLGALGTAPDSGIRVPDTHKLRMDNSSTEGSIIHKSGEYTYNDLADYHLDEGSIGAIYDARIPDIVTFFYYNENEDGFLFESKDIKALQNGVMTGFQTERQKAIAYYRATHRIA